MHVRRDPSIVSSNLTDPTFLQLLTGRRACILLVWAITHQNDGSYPGRNHQMDGIILQAHLV